MRRYTLLSIIVLVLSVGCRFDGDMETDIAFPRTLELQNISQKKIDVTAVYSSPDGISTFSLNSGSLPPGGHLSWRIRMEAYDDIRASRFILLGTCGDEEPWEKKGTALKQYTVTDEDRGKITIAIPSCDI